MRPVPTLATVLHARGFATGAFVGAFPLDARFGLARGFDVYSDRMPRGSDGRVLNERPGEAVAAEAVAWMQAHASERLPALDARVRTARSVQDPADAHLRCSIASSDDISTADRAVGRVLDALGAAAASTLVVSWPAITAKPSASTVRCLIASSCKARRFVCHC